MLAEYLVLQGVESRPLAFGEPQHVDRRVHAGLRRLHRIEEEVVHAEHVAALLEQALAEVGADEAGASGDQDAAAGGVGAGVGVGLVGMVARV